MTIDSNPTLRLEPEDDVENNEKVVEESII